MLSQWIANGYLCGIFETAELSRILFYNLSDVLGCCQNVETDVNKILNTFPFLVWFDLKLLNCCLYLKDWLQYFKKA